MDELANLKLPELKKECKARGLSANGNKADLVSRLQAAMAAEKPPSDDSVLDDALLDDDSVLGDDDSSAEDSGQDLNDSPNAIDLSSPVSTVPPVSIISRGSPQKRIEATKRPLTISPTKVASQTNGDKQDGSPPQKKKITINRETNPTAAVAAQAEPKSEVKEGDQGEKKVIKMGDGLTAEEKAKLRAQKFGLSDTVTSPAKIPAAPQAIAANPFLDERLKKRGERFNNGTDTQTTKVTTGVVSLTTEEDIKLAKRKERFGITVVDDGARKETRAARFGATTKTVGASTAADSASSITSGAAATDSADKKSLRAARFGSTT